MSLLHAQKPASRHACMDLRAACPCRHPRRRRGRSRCKTKFRKAYYEVSTRCVRARDRPRHAFRDQADAG
eukprot:4596108-Pleurochrysis_carterae.AAC.2